MFDSRSPAGYHTSVEHLDSDTSSEAGEGQDLTPLIQAWDFNPDSNVRKIKGADGVQKVQVRVDQGAFQGILQLSLDGRPDGKKPHGHDFALDYYRSLLDEHRRQNRGEDGFSLDSDACQELFEEGARVYGRYAFLLQIKDYDRVVRDTERNMELFRFVDAHGEGEEDRLNLEKWWPYILRINATARCKLAQGKGDFDRALEVVGEAREQIDDLAEVDAEEFFVERKRSHEALDELEESLRSKRPPSQTEKLEQELQEAVDHEEFERAASIRDELNELRNTA
jgi:hypothetical protein